LPARSADSGPLARRKRTPKARSCSMAESSISVCALSIGFQKKRSV
jgi:hypothetical protein